MMLLSTLTLILTTLTGTITVVVWGKLNCDPGYTLELGVEECVPCKLGTYKSQFGSQPCTSCPTSQDGHPASTHSIGSTHSNNCYFRPYIRQFSPTFGPLSGGTLVNINIAYLADRSIVSITIGGIEAECVERRNTSVVCQTGPSSTTQQKSVELLMSDLWHEYIVRSERYFFYRPDPVIYGVDNPETILSGGTTLVVRGENLTSVSIAELVITRVFMDKVDHFTATCSIVNSTLMLCPVPDMSVGLVSPNTTMTTHNQKPLLSSSSSSSSSRVKRHEEEMRQLVNNQTLQFFVGFHLDGVDEYTNVTTLRVYRNPEVSMFTEPGHIKEFDAKHGLLHISGENLNDAVDISDYRITIGAAECNITYITTNQLVCVPPLHQPEHGLEPGPQDTYYVIVHIGKNLSYVVGYLKYDNSSDRHKKFVLIMTLLGVFLGWVAIMWLACLLWGRKKWGYLRKLPAKRHCSTSSTNTTSNVSSGGSGDYLYPVVEGSDYSSNGEAFYLDIMDGSHSGHVMEQLDERVRHKVSSCTLEPYRLHLGDVISQGSYGCIMKGQLKEISEEESKEVTVKTIKSNSSTEDDWEQADSEQTLCMFLKESLVLLGFLHPHVIFLHGVVIKENVPYVVLEYMDKGDLRSHLINGAKDIPVQVLLSFCVQVADAMMYLSGKGFVHKDLAARNCMINSGNTVKVADSSLSRDLYSSDYYNRPDQPTSLPLRWMAPESLLHNVYSIHSDVWSFGVLMWEVLTRGDVPYLGVDHELLGNHLLAGHRLDPPKGVSPAMESLLDICWSSEPESRPDFTELHDKLRAFHDAEGQVYVVDSTEPSRGYLELM